MFDREKRERQRRMMEVVSDYLWASVRFEEMYKAYKGDRLIFEDLESFIDDRGKSLIYQVKQNCHALFRRDASAGMEKERLFDLTVGTIFHEAMKIRENLYQLEVYGEQGRALEAKEERTKNEEDFLRQLNTSLRRAARGFAEGMEETRNLFREATGQLKALLPDFRSNGLLLRFFHEQGELTAKVLGATREDDPFRIMFPDATGTSYATAGRSYLESGRFGRARECFGKSIEEGCGDPALPALLAFARGMSFFYAEEHEQALLAFAEVTDQQGLGAEARTLLPEIGRVARRIASELRELGNTDTARQASLLADRAGAPPV